MSRFGEGGPTGSVAYGSPPPQQQQYSPPQQQYSRPAPVARVESRPLNDGYGSAALPPPPQPHYAQTPPSHPAQAAAPAPRVIPATSYPEPQRTAAAPMTRRAPASGTHAVAPGETLYSIARQYDVGPRALAEANGLRMDVPIRAGQRLTIPGVAQSRIRTAAVAPTQTQAQPQPQRVAAVAPARSAPTRADVTPTEPAPQPQRVAARSGPPAPERVEQAKIAEPAPQATGDDEAGSASPAVAGLPSFRWPVRGRVISGFGPKPDGQRNDGINLAVPEGTSIRAAEDGVVAYAGNELKGYGNLILVRHENGYVTAYAHASELKVKRGDTVRRGQVIALAGQTGNVSSPQLHFEIRRGSTPVDPVQHLASN